MRVCRWDVYIRARYIFHVYFLDTPEVDEVYVLNNLVDTGELHKEDITFGNVVAYKRQTEKE